jgi:hypothetical protein
MLTSVGLVKKIWVLLTCALTAHINLEHMLRCIKFVMISLIFKSIKKYCF